MHEVITKRYNKLVDMALYYRKRYYQDAVSEITDYEYDMLEKTIQEIEDTHPWLQRSDSPTVTVGC